MECAVCGGELRAGTTDLPSKVSDSTIVIFKGLPVFQCASCPEYLIEDKVLQHVDVSLAKVKGGTELEIVRYAA